MSKKWRVLQNHFSIELDDSRLLQFNVHLVWFSKQKKLNITLHFQNKWDSSCHFRNSQLKDLQICQSRCTYHELCWNPFKGNWHNGKVLHFAFRSQHGPENRVLGGWQDKFVGVPKMWTLPLLLMVIHSAPVEVGSLSLCEDRCFLHQRSVVQDLVRHQQNSSLQRLHLWCEISWNFHSIQPHSIIASVYGIFCPTFSRILWDQCR